MSSIVFKAIVAFVVATMWDIGIDDIMLNNFKIFNKIWKWLGEL